MRERKYRTFAASIINRDRKIMDFTGKIIAVLSKKNGVAKATGNPWAAQEYVIENHDQYPRKMCFEVFGEEKIAQFNIQAGEELTVSFDIDARQWQDRWFNQVRAWKVERVAPGTVPGVATPTAVGGAAVPPPPAATPDFLAGDDRDDLPF
jgi:hypothetical protein